MANKRILSVFIRYGAAVLVLAAVVVPIFLLAGKNKSVYTAPKPAVTAAKPDLRTIDVSITLSGHVEARSMIPVIPLVSGILMEYPVKAGQSVQKGDVLAVIDEEPFRQHMLQAKAAYTGYESAFSRLEGLYGSGAATRQEYDTVKAQRDAAKAQYELAVLQLGYARVTAPVSGTVLTAPLAAGNVGSSQQPVAVIADLSDLVVRLDVPEKYFSLFTADVAALEASVVRPATSLTAALNGEQCRAVADTIAPYVDGASKSFRADFRLVDAPDTFRPGMYVKVTVVFRRYEQVPALPVTVRKTDGSVYLFNPDEAITSSAPTPGTAVSAGFSSVSAAGTELIAGTTEHVVLPFDVSDGSWYMVPKEYADRWFIIEGQGTVFDRQPVSAVIAGSAELGTDATHGGAR